MGESRHLGIKILGSAGVDKTNSCHVIKRVPRFLSEWGSHDVLGNYLCMALPRAAHAHANDESIAHLDVGAHVEIETKV